MDVDHGDRHEKYSMTMFGLDYLEAREAVIDLRQGVLSVNGTIVKGKYKYAEVTPVRTHKVRLVNDCHLFQIQ